MKLTIKIKLLATQEQKQQLLNTMTTFNEACNHISDIAFQNKKFGQVGLHHLCYQNVRRQFGLSSQLTVRAIGKVSESYKATKKTKHTFKPRSAVVYDNRLYSVKGLNIISILSLDGRLIIPIQVGTYANLEQRRIKGQADLIYYNKNFYLCVVVEFPEAKPLKTDGFLGVDVGIVNLATTSKGTQYSGKTIDKVRFKTTQHRARLQKKGTKSAKRRLKKISRRMSRFTKNTNHTISKQIVKTAKALNLGISVENLKKIKKTVRKAERQRFGSWSFYQLISFIEYKSKLAGLPFIKVNPAYTSQTCSHCGHVEKRNRQSQSVFVCKHCGLSMNADINAAINIAARASINEPIVASIKVA